ncbi:MAG: TfoX/Sxy family protein [Eggerthellaceae bacterium]|nr:TfoX/Sxy family protein [Eggerthellaceae bacterium]
MASSEEYLDYVLDLLSIAPEITTRKMMGEYMLYSCGRIFGGVYDDRFLVKDTPASRAVLSTYEMPYEGGSPMLLVDIEDRVALAELIAEMLPDLPAPKKRK